MTRLPVPTLLRASRWQGKAMQGKAMAHWSTMYPTGPSVLRVSLGLGKLRGARAGAEAEGSARAGVELELELKLR